MKTDSQLQKDVMDELKWQPFLKSSEIGVAVKSGIVTLSGIVDSYSKKLDAERATKKVASVKAIAEDIQIGVSPFRKSDSEIADAVYTTLKWHSTVPDDRVIITVDDSVVTLEGELEWDYQKVDARKAIQNLAGVRSIKNLITIKPRLEPFQLKQSIKAAFQRNAAIDASKISVSTVGSKVTLTGKVRSLAESEDAEEIVWAAPGVYFVDNRIEIEQPENS